MLRLRIEPAHAQNRIDGERDAALARDDRDKARRRRLGGAEQPRGIHDRHREAANDGKAQNVVRSARERRDGQRAQCFDHVLQRQRAKMPICPEDQREFEDDFSQRAPFQGRYPISGNLTASQPPSLWRADEPPTRFPISQSRAFCLRCLGCKSDSWDGHSQRRRLITSSHYGFPRDLGAQADLPEFPVQPARRLVPDERASDNAAQMVQPVVESCVLVVDDHRPNLVLAEAMLGSAGYKVVTAASAEEALDLLGTFVPSLVLVDIALPGMNGLEFTRRVRSEARLGHMPVVALTACAMPGDEARVLEAGCVAYVTKPIDFQKLLKTVAKALEDAPPSTQSAPND